VAGEEEIVMKTLLVVVAVLVASPVFAQPAPKGPPAPGAQQEIRREKIKKRIRALRAYTLTEELTLDEQTAAKLFPILAKFDDEFDKLLVARADVQRRLESSAAVTDPKQLDKLIDDAVANQRAMWETEEKRLAQLRKILTPAQTARVLVVLPAMERKIQNQLRRAMRKAERAKADSADDDDDDALDVHPFAPGPAKAPPRPARPGAVCDPFADARGCPKK
jgi:hypothetical protein